MFTYFIKISCLHFIALHQGMKPCIIIGPWPHEQTIQQSISIAAQSEIAIYYFSLSFSFTFFLLDKSIFDVSFLKFCHEHMEDSLPCKTLQVP